MTSQRTLLWAAMIIVCGTAWAQGPGADGWINVRDMGASGAEFETIAKRAGVTRFNPHAFRHGALQAALEHGADITTISQLAGHSTIQITHKFYARWQKTELKAQHAKHSWMKNGDRERT